MSPRPYTQRQRAESAAETRRLILDTVFASIRARPGGPITLGEVARDAGVARSTVYLAFGSRAGLFEAVTTELARRTGLAAVEDALADPDPREHLRRGMRAQFEMFAADREVWASLWAMSRADPQSLGATRSVHEGFRRKGLEDLVAHLEACGVLRDDVSAEEASNVLWALASFEAFDLLCTDKGVPVDQAITQLVAAAERAVCR